MLTNNKIASLAATAASLGFDDDKVAAICAAAGDKIEAAAARGSRISLLQAAESTNPEKIDLLRQFMRTSRRMGLDLPTDTPLSVATVDQVFASAVVKPSIQDRMMLKALLRALNVLM